MGNVQTPQVVESNRYIVIYLNGARTRLFPIVLRKAADVPAR